MNTNTPENGELVSYLEEEVKRLKKVARKTFIAGSILVVALMLYLGVMLITYEKLILNPDYIAALVIGNSQQTLFHMSDEVAKSLTDNAPKFADNVSQSALRMLPDFRLQAEKEIELAYKEKIPSLNNGLSSMMKDFVERNADSLREYAQKHTGDEFAEYFMETVMDDVKKEIDQTLKPVSQGGGLDFFTENMTVTMDAMNDRVDDLLKQDISKMSRRDRLQRKLLAVLAANALDTTQKQDNANQLVKPPK